jgi:sec-independent protein translocase protein TatA
MSTSVVLGMFGIGQYELLIVAGVALLLFGHRLPSVMRSLGRGVTEFKKGVQGIEDDVESASSERPPKPPTGDIQKPIEEK